MRTSDWVLAGLMGLAIVSFFVGTEVGSVEVGMLVGTGFLIMSIGVMVADMVRAMPSDQSVQEDENGTV